MILSPRLTQNNKIFEDVHLVALIRCVRLPSACCCDDACPPVGTTYAAGSRGFRPAFVEGFFPGRRDGPFYEFMGYTTGHPSGR